MATTARPTTRNDLTIHPHDSAVRIEAPSLAETGYAGITIYRPGMGVLRVKLTLDDPESVDEGVAEFRRDGTTLERWILSPVDLERLGTTRTLVFRRGFDGRRPHSNHVAAAIPDRLDLIFRVKAGCEFSATIHAVNYVAAIDNPSQPRSPGFVGMSTK
jgi:hypothetical protein